MKHPRRILREHIIDLANAAYDMDASGEEGPSDR